MYHPDLIDRAWVEVLAAPEIREQFPHGIRTYTPQETRERSAALQLLWNPQTQSLLRPLDDEEQDFITFCSLRTPIDAPFFLESFVWIDEEGHGRRSLYPLWESQRFVLQRIAAVQQRHWTEGHPDGILINVLKARQLGVSTLAEALVAHRIFTRPFIRAISGSDVEEQASYLLKMVERIYANLPWFLTPIRGSYRTGKELHLTSGSSVKAAWGKTTRGALQDVGGKKGNIERGRTNSIVHISELATWDNPEQLDTALMPGVPVDPDSLVMYESTAELAGDWWHLHYQACADGTTPRDWSNIFIPWCVEPKKYSLPAPASWTPNSTTLAVARQIEREMPTYVGEPITLTRDQLYWYESTRAYYQKKNRVYDFFKEYPSNPEECFQYAGRSIFALEDLERIDHAAKPLIDVWRVEPATEIANLRRLADDPSPEDVRALALKYDRRTAAPAVVRPISPAAAAFKVPPGYGFRRLGQAELDDLLADASSKVAPLRRSVLQIYEHPRTRGRRRYFLGVDVADGLGQDYSVIDVVREPTIEEPGEEVAQFVSNTVKPSELAFICDAIGRLYSDEDGIEACIAVELNNHGITVQDLLQLHLGYSNFYVWEVVDAAISEQRFTKRIGWTTTTRTRPILLSKFVDSVTTLDPISEVADFRLNSPITRAEMRFFVTETTLGEAEHAKGQHDDAIFAAAIGYYVAHRMAGGEAEPIAERRRRRATLLAEHQKQAGAPRRRDYRNTDATADDANEHGGDDAEDLDDRDAEALSYFGSRE